MVRIHPSVLILMRLWLVLWCSQALWWWYVFVFVDWVVLCCVFFCFNSTPDFCSRYPFPVGLLGWRAFLLMCNSDFIDDTTGVSPLSFDESCCLVLLVNGNVVFMLILSFFSFKNWIVLVLKENFGQSVMTMDFQIPFIFHYLIMSSHEIILINFTLRRHHCFSKASLPGNFRSCK